MGRERGPSCWRRCWRWEAGQGSSGRRPHPGLGDPLAEGVSCGVSHPGLGDPLASGAVGGEILAVWVTSWPGCAGGGWEGGGEIPSSGSAL